MEDNLNVHWLISNVPWVLNQSVTSNDASSWKLPAKLRTMSEPLRHLWYSGQIESPWAPYICHLLWFAQCLKYSQVLSMAPLTYFVKVSLEITWANFKQLVRNIVLISKPSYLYCVCTETFFKTLRIEENIERNFWLQLENTMLGPAILQHSGRPAGMDILDSINIIYISARKLSQYIRVHHGYTGCGNTSLYDLAPCN